MTISTQYFTINGEQRTIYVLQAENNMVLIYKEQATYGYDYFPTIYVGINSKPEDFMEVTEEEAKKRYADYLASIPKPEK